VDNIRGKKYRETIYRIRNATYVFVKMWFYITNVAFFAVGTGRCVKK